MQYFVCVNTTVLLFIWIIMICLGNVDRKMWDRILFFSQNYLHPNVCHSLVYQSTTISATQLHPLRIVPPPPQSHPPSLSPAPISLLAPWLPSFSCRTREDVYETNESGPKAIRNIQWPIISCFMLYSLNVHNLLIQPYGSGNPKDTDCTYPRTRSPFRISHRSTRAGSGVTPYAWVCTVGVLWTPHAKGHLHTAGG